MADREGVPASGLFTLGLATRVIALMGAHANLSLDNQPANEDLRGQAIQLFREGIDELRADIANAEPAPEEPDAEPAAEPIDAISLSLYNSLLMPLKSIRQYGATRSSLLWIVTRWKSGLIP
ncbi:hypothetical protein F4815DRAFT_447677 [Daldinia loculata]|uniref:uncharacterized protein n=1 Tax=Daldinia loculata TaxID=103429 RepID=UPI0020C51199|nr:uncharacterized protein F4817DRAFT_312381 [Daldinia loculata]KAI1651026.1 hypothetical protein F4817DRAFT_312381 [Daldinia loculata]KAI2778093.1 hypothetical protein F4815DRAFT_447677 [Daldinia loculata]